MQVKKQPPSNSLLLLTWQKKKGPWANFSRAIHLFSRSPSQLETCSFGVMYVPVHLVSCTYTSIVCACLSSKSSSEGHGSVAAVNKKQRHQSGKSQQLMPADMHQLAAKTNRDALARSSRQLDKMYRLGRGTSKLSRNHRMRASNERVYLRVEETFLPTCYQFCQTVEDYFFLFY